MPSGARRRGDGRTSDARTRTAGAVIATRRAKRRARRGRGTSREARGRVGCCPRAPRETSLRAGHTRRQARGWWSSTRRGLRCGAPIVCRQGEALPFLVLWSGRSLPDQVRQREDRQIRLCACVQQRVRARRVRASTGEVRELHEPGKTALLERLPNHRVVYLDDLATRELPTNDPTRIETPRFSTMVPSSRTTDQRCIVHRPY